MINTMRGAPPPETFPPRGAVPEHRLMLQIAATCVKGGSELEPEAGLKMVWHRSALPDLNESDNPGETPRAWRPEPRGLP